MSSRQSKADETRRRILAAVRDLLAEGAFHDSSMEAIAHRAGVTRVTLYRTFGTKQSLLEGLAGQALASARLDAVDAAHSDPDVRTAVRRVLRANCAMFAELSAAMPLALELARFDGDMAAIIGATYHGRRHRAMERLAARIVEEGPAAEGWSRKRIADALLVLSSHESFQTLVEHRGYSPARAGDLLAAMAAGLFGPTPP